MKERWLLAALIIALAMGTAALPVEAAPSLRGYTGLLLTPTSDALNQGDYNASFFLLNLEEGGDETLWAANLGLSDGLEVGFARLKREDQSGETLLNAKYRFQDEDSKKPALAAGVIDFTDEVDATAYLVLSKSVSELLRGTGGEIASPRVHVGFGGGQLDGIFAGASAVLADKLTLMAEYDTEDVNLGARLALSTEVRVHAGWINGLDNFAIGASFNKAF